VTVDASWLITSHRFRDLAAVFGHTCHDQWQCLSECMAEAVGAALTHSPGFALVLDDFDAFAANRRDDAEGLLGLVAFGRGNRLCWANACSAWFTPMTRTSRSASSGCGEHVAQHFGDAGASVSHGPDADLWLRPNLVLCPESVDVGGAW
jgi:hypothetical protein